MDDHGLRYDLRPYVSILGLYVGRDFSESCQIVSIPYTVLTLFSNFPWLSFSFRPFSFWQRFRSLFLFLSSLLLFFPIQTHVSKSICFLYSRRLDDMSYHWYQLLLHDTWTFKDSHLEFYKSGVSFYSYTPFSTNYTIKRIKLIKCHICL